MSEQNNPNKQLQIQTTNNFIQTQNLGQKFAQNIHGGEILYLFGQLGAGKTCFVKGIAKGLEIKETITSPTFTIINEYCIGSSHRLEPITRKVQSTTTRLNQHQQLITKQRLPHLSPEEKLAKPLSASGMALTCNKLTNSSLVTCHLPLATKLIHIDLYRIKTKEEIIELGLLDYFTNENIVCIEWPEILVKFFPQIKAIEVNFVYKNENEREIVFKNL